MGSVIRFNGQLLKFGGLVVNWLHPRTKALLDYASAQGYKAPTNIGALNTYIMKMNPILDKMDLFYILFGDGDINFKLLNIVNPEVYKGTAFGGLTWDNSGVKGNGVNGYVDTNFNPSLLVEGQKYRQDDASIGAICFSKTPSVVWQDNVLIGGDSNCGIIPSTGLNRLNNGNNGVSGFPFYPDDETFYSITRITNSEIHLVKGDAILTNNHSSSPITNQKLSIFKRTNDNAGFSENGINIAFAGKYLTYEETQLIRQYTNEYLTKLNLDPIA